MKNDIPENIPATPLAMAVRLALLNDSVKMAPMDRDWGRQELSDHWSLGFEELARVEAKSEALRLGYAAHLKVYQIAGRFPSEAAEIPGAARDHLAEQLGRQGAELFDYDWSGRNGQRHRAEILEFLGVRTF